VSTREAKLCECGCGEPAPIARIWQHGYATGQAKRFIQGHNARTVDLYDVDPETGCWVWRGSTPRGYGSIKRDGIRYRAHRYIYEREIGPIPDGLQLDHLCRNRSCVNPEHLEVVSCRENLMRGQTLAAENAAKTHCKRGHPLSGENLYVEPKGTRACKQCRRDAVRRSREKKRAA
jgi:hypothetical protein